MIDIVEDVMALIVIGFFVCVLLVICALVVG